jgi:hypothetical protein
LSSSANAQRELTESCVHAISIFIILIYVSNTLKKINKKSAIIAKSQQKTRKALTKNHTKELLFMAVFAGQNNPKTLSKKDEVC